MPIFTDLPPVKGQIAKTQAAPKPQQAVEEDIHSRVVAQNAVLSSDTTIDVAALFQNLINGPEETEQPVTRLVLPPLSLENIVEPAQTQPLEEAPNKLTLLRLL